jgi:hypothetical protein
MRAGTTLIPQLLGIGKILYHVESNAAIFRTLTGSMFAVLQYEEAEFLNFVPRKNKRWKQS